MPGHDSSNDGGCIDGGSGAGVSVVGAAVAELQLVHAAREFVFRAHPVGGCTSPSVSAAKEAVLCCGWRGDIVRCMHT